MTTRSMKTVSYFLTDEDISTLKEAKDAIGKLAEKLLQHIEIEETLTDNDMGEDVLERVFSAQESIQYILEQDAGLLSVTKET